jgi:hypothetical protein
MQKHPFIKRKYKNIDTNKILKFNELLLNKCSIILGEPASGKTCQLKYYLKNNSNIVEFIELVNIDDIALNIIKNKKLVFIDSIDEALVDYKNPKKVIYKLKQFIKNVLVINENIKFVITSRFLEWNQYFRDSLRESIQDIKVYQIQNLQKEDINILLSKYNIKENTFWKFIDKNNLTYLLSNILIIFNLIEEFQKYNSKINISYTDIYYHICEKLLLAKGEERVDNVDSIKNYLLIISSISTYLILNRKTYIDTNQLPKLVDEIYKIKNINIDINIFKNLLNTPFFRKQDNNFIFFHKSIQEYLCAYFIDYKKISIDKIKELFAYDGKFYEEFEEVIIYLTNLNTNLFDKIVKFDPLIFRKHFFLSANEQEKLLISIIDKLQNDSTYIWGKWEYFQNTTIVKFDKLSNIETILQNHLQIEKIDNVILPYLFYLINHNWSENFQRYIFKILENIVSVKKNLCKNIIRTSFVNHYKFNKQLFYFMKKYQLFKKSEFSVYPFELDLFTSLYGIKYKNKFDKQRYLQRTDFDFKELIYLIDMIPVSNFEYFIPYINQEDSKIWFEYMQNNYQDNKYTSEYLAWLVYCKLKNDNSIDSLKEVINFILKNQIFIYHIDKSKMRLKSEILLENYWQLHFNGLIDNFYCKFFLELLDISLEDIKKATQKYPIEKYTEKYTIFRLVTDVDDFLMQNNTFKIYMQNLLKKQEKQQKEWDKKIEEKLKNSEQYQHSQQIKQLQDEICQDSKALRDKNDYYNLYFYLYQRDEKIDDILTKEQKDYFLQILKDEFIIDNSYFALKQQLNSNSLSNRNTFLFEYLFKLLSLKEIFEFIDEKDKYTKLFWHYYKMMLNDYPEYFIELTRKYFKIFIDLMIESIKLSLLQSNNKKIGSIYFLVEVIKKIDKYNLECLNKLIVYLKTLDKNILINLDTYEKETIFDIMMLDKNNFNLFIELMLIDNKRLEEYLNVLMKLDINHTLKEFFRIYNNIQKYRTFTHKKPQNFFLLKIVTANNYDNILINSKKIEIFKLLMKSLAKNKNKFLDINSKYLKIIIYDYYEFFKPYKTPEGVFTPDIYHNMSNTISYIWQILSKNENFKSLLEKLSTHQNRLLSDNAKYSLSNLLNKFRTIDNKYYKNILEQEDEMKNVKNINITNGNYIEENNGTVNNTIHNLKEDKLVKEKFYQNWYIISLFISFIGSISLYFSFNLFIAIIGFIIFFITMIIFNPKRRFFRVALSVLSAGILEFISLDWIIQLINFFLNTSINIKFEPNYIAGISMLLLSSFLFYLDYEENKN